MVTRERYLVIVQRLILTLMFLSFLCVCPQAYAKQYESNKSEELLEMSLEELMDVTVESSPGTLTKTATRIIPSSVTTITADMIRHSGARRLNEVFDIFVPNLMILRHHNGMDHIGIRGINGDMKFLFMVNGRIMNNRSMAGAMSERDLPMMDDIHHIDVIRGPGSVIYGPGAIAGVINVITHNALTLKGSGITIKQGFIEKFKSLEVHHSIKLGDDRGLLIYGGVTDYQGADPDDSPYVFGRSFTTPDAFDNIIAGKAVSLDSIRNDQEPYRDKLKSKIHIQYTDGPLDIWARFTRGGIRSLPTRRQLATKDQFETGVSSEDILGWTSSTTDISRHVGTQYGYQQLTLLGEYTHEFSDYLSVDFTLSYDMFDYEELPYRYPYITSLWYNDTSPWPAGVTHRGGLSILEHLLADSRHKDLRITNMREDEYYTRILGRWTPNDNHSVAAGFEWSHEVFGLKSPGFPDDIRVSQSSSPAGLYLINDFPAWSSTLGQMGSWQTNTYSLLGEYQWHINDKWTTFLGARFDRHTFTDWMFSPRAALVWTPNEKDTYKFMMNQSVRRNKDEYLKAQFDDSGAKGSEETIQNWELRYERQQSDNWWVAGNLFYYDLELLSWDASQNKTTSTGEYDAWGAELEISYRTEKAYVMFSHGYTKLIDFDNATTGEENQTITAEAYGFGNDLLNWSNHISKLYARYELDPKWSIDGSMRVYWGFPGAEDYSDYNRDRIATALADGSSSAVTGVDPSYSLADDGYEEAWRASMFLNLGIEHRPSENLTIRLDAQNVLGWIKEEFNKRNYNLRMSDYRAEAPALSFTVRYTF
ncbi:MAG: TonB-dependent receptor [Planctomycetes bacterium]|nr:TonB-dependent receptor [Planctomycetota bacterium]